MKPLSALFIRFFLFICLVTGISPQRENSIEAISRTVTFQAPIIQPKPAAKSITLPGAARLDNRLESLLIALSLNGNSNGEAEAGSLGLSLQNNRIAVRLEPVAPQAAVNLERLLVSNGGEVTANIGDVLLARIPVRALGRIAESQDLLFMSPQVEVVSFPAKRTITEGVGMIDTAPLNSQGITGRGVRIGILDFGFEGYSKLQGNGILPPPKAARAFTSNGKLENGDVHGTGCAEIIHAIAPDAELYLAVTTAGEDGFIRAALWLAEQNVNIINFSGGTVFDRTDGHSSLSLLVDELTRRRNILWVSAAGNDGDRHWRGLAVDRNHDGMVDIDDKASACLLIKPSVDQIKLVVRWNDWGPDPRRPSATDDIDAYLFEYANSAAPGPLVARAEETQNGRGQPIEVLTAKVNPNKLYLLALRMANVHHPDLVHVFTNDTAEIAPNTPDGSVLSPAASRLALAVGAARISNGQLADYSSQGPTDDGRIKPEVSAPTEVATYSYASASSGFSGTSAATPHVTGFAALLKQEVPSVSAVQLRLLVSKCVISRGYPVPNNQYGYGLISAHVLATRLPHQPENGSDSPIDTQAVMNLPAAWGGTVPVSVLERVTQTTSGRSSLKVQLVLGRDAYHVGDGMKVGYRAAQDCYYLLLHRDSSGRFTLIAPDVFSATMLQANRAYVIPGAGASILIRQPLGEEQVFLIAGVHPVDLLHASPEQIGALTIVSAQFQVLAP